MSTAAGGHVLRGQIFQNILREPQAGDDIEGILVLLDNKYTDSDCNRRTV